ncbi:MAG: hypothetical protein HY598_02985 [Candidatus Omnitrophica bacterium]|nr:hypothetical protein [Candidatus Omnitrophota bacterium]
MILRRRDRAITWFVICWSLLFFYETFRASYLSPLAGRPLPKWPLLFPPAGWIMFFNVDKTYGFAEVYGLRNGRHALIDPHDIFSTKGVGYDNIHRNVLVGVLSPRAARPFCAYLTRKFPDYEAFVVVYAQYPDVVDEPDTVWRQTAYQCH